MAYSRKKIKSQYELFVKQYTRKKQKSGSDPNDRCYDRKLEEVIKKMKPEDLFDLLNDDENIDK